MDSRQAFFEVVGCYLKPVEIYTEFGYLKVFSMFHRAHRIACRMSILNVKVMLSNKKGKCKQMQSFCNLSESKIWLLSRFLMLSKDQDMLRLDFFSLSVILLLKP